MKYMVLYEWLALVGLFLLVWMAYVMVKFR
jgi:hypothetical protein